MICSRYPYTTTGTRFRARTRKAKRDKRQPRCDRRIEELTAWVAKNAPSRARTWNLRFRRPTLYPIELKVLTASPAGNKRRRRRLTRVYTSGGLSRFSVTLHGGAARGRGQSS